MDKLLSDIKEGIKQFSKERQSLTHINEEKKQSVLSELQGWQYEIPVLSKHAIQSRNREYKNTIYELDAQLDDEIVAWENITTQTEDSQTNTEPKTTETITEPNTTETTTEPKTTETITETTTDPKTTETITEPKTTETITEPKTTETITEPKTTETTEPKTTETTTEPKTTETITEPKTTETITEPKTTTPSTHKKGEDGVPSPKIKPPEELASYFSNLFIELELNDESEYLLSLYNHGFTNWKENASTEKDSMPFIIGLIGDTHVGKSAMIEPIIKSLTQRDIKQKIVASKKKDLIEDDDKKFQGDSANISLFSTDKLEGTNNSKIYVLDMEGTSANNTPSILEKGIMWILEDTPSGALRNKLLNMLSDPIKRNTAVNTLIPPFAYLVCDMLIFISTDTFDNSSFIQRVSKFTKSINIQASDRPSLVLISNKVNVVGSVFDDCTKMFYSLETKDDSGALVSVEAFLKAWYSSITCICLPNWNEAGYINDDLDSMEMAPIGIIKFIEQIGKLKSIISTEIQKRKDLRNQYGQHLSEKTLLATLENFLKNHINYSDQTKRLLDYYNFTISNVSGEVNLVFRVFDILLCKINKACEDPGNVIKNFNKICEFAMIYLAIHISLCARKKIDGPQYVVEIAPNWKTEAHQLIDLLNKSQLCFGFKTYQFPGDNTEIKRESEGNRREKVFRCTKEYKEHQSDPKKPSDHYSNQQLFAPDVSLSYIKRWFTQLMAYFRYGYYPRWDGEFEPHANVITSNDLENSFEKAIKTVFEKNSLIECLHYAAKLMKSLTNEDPIDVSINHIDKNYTCVEINYCSICFEEGHTKLCKRCQIFWEKEEISEDWKLS